MSKKISIKINSLYKNFRAVNTRSDLSQLILAFFYLYHEERDVGLNHVVVGGVDSKGPGATSSPKSGPGLGLSGLYGQRPCQFGKNPLLSNAHGCFFDTKRPIW